MFCTNCGKEIPDGSVVCGFCGEAIADMNAGPKKKKRKPSSEKLMKEGEKISDNVFFCSDGKYRWVYEMSLFKNPTIFFLVWKIFFFILIGIFAVVAVFDLFGGGSVGEKLLNDLKFLGYFLAGMTVLCILGYLLYAAIMGGKYCVLFEMDENGVNHKQMEKQAKKAEVISTLTVLAGLAAGNPTTVGVGLTSSRTEMYTEFARVKKVRFYPGRELIKVNETLNHNQVYAEKGDYEFVKNYIVSHCTNAK